VNSRVKSDSVMRLGVQTTCVAIIAWAATPATGASSRRPSASTSSWIPSSQATFAR
jgi:hypothetical protein